MDLEEVRRKKARGQELTKKERDLLTQFWRSGTSTKPQTVKISTFLSGFKPSVIPETKVSTAGVLVCSFCQKEVSRLEATTGKQPEIRVREEVLSINPMLVVGKQVMVKSNRVVACPNCANKIKPSVDRDGNYIRHNTDYEFTLE